jgi:hypothetical protein
MRQHPRRHSKTVEARADALADPRNRSASVEDDEPLPRFHEGDLVDRNEEKPPAEVPTPDLEEIGPVDARAEPHAFDRSDDALSRVDGEVVAPREPVVAVARLRDARALAAR